MTLLQQFVLETLAFTLRMTCSKEGDPVPA